MTHESILSAYGQSHVGNVRVDNQDALRIFEPKHGDSTDARGSLYGIADGMGGYEHGGVASALALETFFRTFYGGSPAKPSQNLRQCVQNANLAVYQTSQRMSARMGTTLTVVNVTGKHLHIAHVGDSRAYHIRGRKAICLTNDHTAVGELVRMRLLSPDKVRKHERRSVLEKSLGIQLFTQPDITSHVIDENDYLILCTDGVWASVEDDEFARLTADLKQPERISQTLLDLALERGSDDNVSALVVHAVQLAPAPAAAETTRLSFVQILRGRFTGKA